MQTYYIILLVLISICNCLQLPYCPMFINKSINIQKCNKKIIANLDDIINYHHDKNIIGLMTHILPLFINYNKIEFVISYDKINSLLQKGFTQNSRLLQDSLHKVANHRAPSTAQNSLKKDCNFIKNSLLKKEINTYII